ncbi:MAG: shikimate kinase [Actinomycetota bacterium]|nr:shikimate kinase [Actinomycetota bacterium]
MTGPLLVLVGPPGAGKTAVGSLVADRLGLPFRDTDRDVETVAGKSVADVFVDDGEAVFRTLERAAVASALAEHEGVLALGGGAVLDPATRESLRGRPVVALSVGLTDAVKRVGLARDRPLLSFNPRAHLRLLLAEREPLYADVATVTVVTDGRSIDDIAEEVLLHVG